MLYNFELQNKLYLKKIDSTCYFYKHITGAEFIFIDNDDSNKVFSITFKTLPEDNKGTAHILEHSVLCGSERFPLKDTFNELASCSLYTYLNAMTFKDRTVFPVASVYEDEFIKLIRVYLDGVFKPLLRFETFLHEAWHYEKKISEDLSPENFNGVVYSEMKSTFSNPVRRARSFIYKKVFPDSIYQFESSGIPQDIPKLSYEELIAFHKKYYTAQNSYIYLYGDIKDLNVYLELFDSYLSSNKSNIDKSVYLINKQNALENSITASSLYNFSSTKKNFFAAGYVISDAFDIETQLAINIINMYLLKSAGAPLIKFLPSVRTLYETDLFQPVYFIYSENFNGSTDKFMNTVTQILFQICKAGLNKILLESCINKLEFELVSRTYKYKPKGLVINLSIMPNWIYGGNIENIFSSLYERETLEKLKTKIYEKYFDYCMEKYLIINKHAAFISLIPDVEKNIDVKISERDIDNLSMMKKFIDAPETNFDVIDVADINKELINYDKVTEYKNILHINIESDEIIYVDFIFNTDSVPKGFLYELGVLSEILVFVSLENIQQNNTNKNMRALLDCIGKVKTEFTVENIQNCNQHVMYMKLRTRFLRDDAQNIIDLINNISSIKKFGDKNLIKKLLMQKMINMNNTYLSDLEEIIKIKALSYHIREFKCQEMVSGIDFYLFLRDLVSDFDDRFRSLIKNLYIIHDRIFTQDNLTIQIACNNENLNFMHATLDHFTDSLKHKNKKHVNYDFNNQIINEGFFTSANVNSNTMVIPLNNNNAKSGVEYVLENLITRDYLTQSIRLNGGAYDTGCDFIDGVIYFYSSADPNIKTTFESFLSAPDYIINKNFSERDLKKAIIGAINNFDKIKSIENRIAISFTRYINNITYDDIHKIHKEMREVNIDQLKYLASVIKNNLEKSTILTVGKRSEILNNKDIYDKIYKLI